MSTPPFYCPHCGAANVEGEQLCFSCQFPLASGTENAQDALLNGRYQLLTQVGSGGFGGVYRAIDTAEARKIVAVKQINLRGLSVQEVIEATDGFHREVRLLSALQHPNLPVIRDTFTDAEHWYLVMDFIEGATLEEYLKEKGRPGLPLKEVLALGLQICTVLDYLHTRQPVIIFRDLKPSNVMRTPEAHLYLIDFGIARHFTPGKPKDTMPFGSPGFAAPEQYGKAQTTPQADIYSLGALLHYLLTGSDPAENPFRFAPLAPGELNTLIQRMVAKEPEERPASIAKVKITLEHLADETRREEYQVLLSDAQSTPIWPGLAPGQVSTKPTHIARRRAITGILATGGIVVGIVGVVSLCTFALHPRFAGIVAMTPPSPGITQQQFIYRGHKGPITAVSWSPDGTMVASGSTDGTVQVWRSADGALLYTFSGYTDAVTSVVWATDRANVIASAGNDDGTVEVWDALRDHQDLTFNGDGRVLALSWKLHSPWIVSGGTDEDIYTWNATTGAKGASYDGHKGNVNTVIWLPDTNIFNPIPLPTSSTTPGTVLTRQIIASGGADSTIQIWDASTGQHILTYTGHQGAVNGLTAVQYAPGQTPQYIVSASDDGTARVWSFNAKDLAADAIYRRHHGKVNALGTLSAVPYYGPRIASASDDKTVQIWTTSGEHLTTYTGHQAPVKTLATSPTDDRVVSGDTNGLVHLWTVTRSAYQ